MIGFIVALDCFPHRFFICALKEYHIQGKTGQAMLPTSLILRDSIPLEKQQQQVQICRQYHWGMSTMLLDAL